MTAARDFTEMRKRWPHSDRSVFVQAGRLKWHVQRFNCDKPDAPTVLLLHGTGASTHSWMSLMPLLAETFHVIAPDLPGHGFSERPPTSQLSLDGMSRHVADLCKAMECAPDLVIGHSAGAAIAVNMAVDGRLIPKALISLAGAFLPIGGNNNSFFSLMAKMMAGNPFSAKIFAWRCRNPAIVLELMQRTGSKLDPKTMEGYTYLSQNARHVSAALGMMANWGLRSLIDKLTQLTPPLLIVTGGKDTMIPIKDADEVERLVPTSERLDFPDLGHLLHEEEPGRLVDAIHAFAARNGIISVEAKSTS